MEYILALDQGSSSSRALLFDLKGRLRFAAQFPLRSSYPRPGWVEHSPEEIVRTLEKAGTHVLAKLGPKDAVLGVGLASQRSTVILWDKQTGRPVVPALSWQDARAKDLIPPLMPQLLNIHDRTGLYLNAFFSAPKIRWALDNVPQARDLAAGGRLLAGPVPTYLLWRWSGGSVFATEPTLAQRMMLMNLETLDWDPELMSLLGIPREVLPRVAADGGPVGEFKVGRWRIPVVGVAGDQQAAFVGLSGFESGGCVANYGTGAFLLKSTGSQLHRVQGLLSSVGAGAGRHYILEGTVHAAGSLLDWLEGRLGVLKSPKEAALLCGKSKNRVWVLPAIGGLGAPRWDYATRTSLFGFTARSERSDLVRGAVEGIGFLISDVAAAIRGAGIPVPRVLASGGLAGLDPLLQFQADLLQAEVARSSAREATALGAARLAARSLGLDASGGGWAPKTDVTFSPKMSQEESGKLLAGWTKFVEGTKNLTAELSALGVLG